MSQAMVFSVAMNSKKHALVALLIAANFTEIKGEQSTVVEKGPNSQHLSLLSSHPEFGARPRFVSQARC